MRAAISPVAERKPSWTDGQFAVLPPLKNLALLSLAGMLSSFIPGGSVPLLANWSPAALSASAEVLGSGARSSWIKMPDMSLTPQRSSPIEIGNRFPKTTHSSLLSLVFNALARRSISRRHFAATVFGSSVLSIAPGVANSFQPPFGDVDLLLPLLQCRDIIVECNAAVLASSGSEFDWRRLQQRLNQPPITQTRSGKVGSGFRSASEAYDLSLKYVREIDDADRQFCYVSKAVKLDEQCLQRLYSADRAFRAILRSEVLTGLQDIESEAAYLARCTQAKYASSGPSSPLSDGIVCSSDLSDTSEMLRILNGTLASFDQLFASVSKAEIQAGMTRLHAKK